MTAPIASLAARDLLPLAAAISAAHERGMLDALAARPAAADDLARTLDLDARAVELVLEVLHQFGLLERADGRFAPAPALRAAERASPGGFAADRWLWPRLRDFLRDGAPITEIDQGGTGRARLYAGVVSGLGDLWAEAAGCLAARLAGHGPRVLDVGCGSGVWSLALAAASPGCAVTGVDFEAVLPALVARAAALELSDRVRTIAGDAHRLRFDEGPLDGAFDVALIANLLRLESAEQAAALVARVARALGAGGQLVVVDALAEGNPAAERNRAIYALHLGMRTRVGRVHPRLEVERWLTAAGLDRVELLGLGDVPGAPAALRAWRTR